ncbi:MAG TPA: aldehyde dehydrogenase family protein [Actinomycetota bacterium]|nr:aldehyde dehydrogenase family protein [Actinomycetota bacterium]
MPDDLKLLIGGEWVDSASGATFEATSPSTGEVIARVPEGAREDAQRAIAAANDAWRDWAARSAFERAGAMRRMAEIVRERRDELSRTLSLDQGKPLRAEANDEVEELIAYFEMASADATRIEGLIPPSVDAGKRVLVYRVPRGVVGVISPWNWPYTMPGELLAPALACGNAVVWVPAPSTSVCAVKLAECIQDAGLPPGVFSMVTGPGPVVGDEIAANPGTHAVGFIGSIATGHRVAERAAGKELLLEMGGNGPLVILEDADLDAAVAGTLTACFLNAGQSCTAGERILIHESVHDEYLTRLRAAIDGAIRLGDPFDEATTMGPLNNPPVADKTEQHVADAVDGGAEVLVGGKRAPHLGSELFFEATVVDGVTDEMAIAREETFGPVVPVSTITSEEEAVRIVNGSPYGLLSAVFTRDLRRGLRYAEAVRTGWVNVNEGTNYWESHLPFGGAAGSASGVGRVGGRFSLERLTELKTVVVGMD